MWFFNTLQVSEMAYFTNIIILNSIVNTALLILKRFGSIS